MCVASSLSGSYYFLNNSSMGCPKCIYESCLSDLCSVSLIEANRFAAFCAFWCSKIYDVSAAEVTALLEIYEMPTRHYYSSSINHASHFYFILLECAISPIKCIYAIWSVLYLRWFQGIYLEGSTAFVRAEMMFILGLTRLITKHLCCRIFCSHYGGSHMRSP